MKYQVYQLTALIALLTACQAEQIEMHDTEQPMPIRLGYSICDGLEVATRAETGSGRTFATGTDKVNIYLWDVTGGKKVAIGNSPNLTLAERMYLRQSADAVQYSGFSSSLVYPAGCTHIDIHAIWPNTVNNSTTTFTVRTNQTAKENLLLSELMYADVKQAERSMYPIMMNFQNQMARVTINITGSASTKLSSVKLKNVYPSINIDPTNSALGGVTGSTGDITVTTTSASAAAVLPPQTITAGNTFIQVVTTDSRTINFKLGANRTLKSGHNYIYNLVITDLSDTERTISSGNEVNETPVAYFTFCNGVQQFIVPETGNYKLEAWGAKGGNSGQTQSASITLGGAGGYTYGNFTLQKGTILYLVPGEKGHDQKNTFGGEGGYNGGGDSGDGYGYAGGGGGGGATHIALLPGLLAELSGQRDKILMVAGGGGGGSWCSDTSRGYSNSGDGGEGGGENARHGARDYRGKLDNANRSGSYWGATFGAGKDENGYYGYAFGIGQPGRTSLTTLNNGGEGGGGGGGGWYGGYSFNAGYYKILKYNSNTDCLYRWVDESTLTEAQKTAARAQWNASYANQDHSVGAIHYNTAQGTYTDTGGGGGSGYLNTSFSVNGNTYIVNSGATITGNQSVPSPTDPSVTVTGNSGNGAVRITKLF